MIGRNHVNSPDVDFFLQKPIADAEMWTGMALYVFFLVRIRAQEGIPMPAGVQEQDVSLPHFGSLLNVLGAEQVELVQHVAQIHNHSRPKAPFNGNFVDGLAVRDKMARRIEASSHVIGW